MVFIPSPDFYEKKYNINPIGNTFYPNGRMTPESVDQTKPLKYSRNIKLEDANIRRNEMTLKELKIGKTAIIHSVGGSGALRQHFLDMGLIQGTEVTVV